MLFRSGNQCRSPIAEFTLRRLLAERHVTGVAVTSAGTLRLPPHPIDPAAADLLFDDGVDASALAAFRSTPLTPEAIEAADLILCFERRQIGELLSCMPAARARTFLFDDAVNACRRLLDDARFTAGATVDDRIATLIDETPLIRPFLPAAAETTDPHAQPWNVFERVHGEILRGMAVLADALIGGVPAGVGSFARLDGLHA